MKTAREIFTSVRALGSERMWLLGILTGGHSVIHWFQQFFPVILPSIKSGLGLSNVEVGALTSVQQMIMGLAQLPVGLLADSMVRHRGNMLALSLVAMGAAYFLLGSPVLPGAAWLRTDRFRYRALASNRRRIFVQSLSGTPCHGAFDSRHGSNYQ